VHKVKSKAQTKKRRRLRQQAINKMLNSLLFDLRKHEIKADLITPPHPPPKISIIRQGGVMIFVRLQCTAPVYSLMNKA
jgi:hypothetical protein